MVSGPEKLDVNSGKPDIHPLLYPYKVQFPHWAPPTLRLGAPCLGRRLLQYFTALFQEREGDKRFWGPRTFTLLTRFNPDSRTSASPKSSL